MKSKIGSHTGNSTKLETDHQKAQGGIANAGDEIAAQFIPHTQPEGVCVKQCLVLYRVKANCNIYATTEFGVYADSPEAAELIAESILHSLICSATARVPGSKPLQLDVLEENIETQLLTVERAITTDHTLPVLAEKVNRD